MQMRHLLTALDDDLDAKIPRLVIQRLVERGVIAPPKNKHDEYEFTQVEVERVVAHLTTPVAPIDRYRRQDNGEE